MKFNISNERRHVSWETARRAYAEALERSTNGIGSRVNVSFCSGERSDMKLIGRTPETCLILQSSKWLGVKYDAYNGCSACRVPRS